MKKWTSLLLTLAMALSLAACGDSGTQENTSEPQESTNGSIAEETPAPTDTEAPAEEPAESETSPAGDSSSVLIAYFSWPGNTEQVAQIIQQETGGDLFEIAPATAYTDDHNELLDIAQQEQADNARPVSATPSCRLYHIRFFFRPHRITFRLKHDFGPPTVHGASTV